MSNLMQFTTVETPAAPDAGVAPLAAGALPALGSETMGPPPPPTTTLDPAHERGIFGLGRALKSARRALSWDKPDSTVELPAVEPAAPLASRDSAEAAEAAEPQERPVGLCGHTSCIAMPEVLGFLSQLRKSGTVWIWNDREQFRVQLVDGNVTFARSESPRQGSLLGEILVAQGAVDAARFEDFMQTERPAGPLGDALIQAGLVTPQALAAAVQYQAQRVFNRAYGLEDAYFRYDASTGDNWAGIRLSVTHMLFESARSRDESAARLDSVLGDPFSGQ
jgi:hypothetical protein